VSSEAPAIRAIGLSKSYGKRLAVDRLDLKVDRAELFGFLGPNGAGKTTTIRMALGLIASTGGSVEIPGLEVRSHRAQVLPRVGALVESPALYGFRRPSNAGRRHSRPGRDRSLRSRVRRDRRLQGRSPGRARVAP
jgi:ABC-type multidrug transport system ATPase subunit